MGRIGFVRPAISFLHPIFTQILCFNNQFSSLLNLDHPERTVREEPAREDLLGPALRIDGQIIPRPPMFSTSQANQQTLPAEPQSFLLVPFANQGAIRGPYQIFNNFRTFLETAQ
jgi:hypothetical protein